jgi:hypothetical protein
MVQTTAKNGLKWLSFCAIIGPIILTLGWIILGLIVPPFQNEYGINGGIIGTITSPISGIGVGLYGFLFNLCFILCGLFTIIGFLGVFLILDNKYSRNHWITFSLLILSPIGFIFAGIFNLAVSVPLHMVGFLLACGTPVISFFAAGFYFRKYASLKYLGNSLFIGSIITLILLIICFNAFDYEVIAAGKGIAGIPSRLFALEICFYYFRIGLLGINPIENNS